MVLPGPTRLHKGPPQPPEGPSLAPRKEPKSRENHQQLLLWREQGHSPGTPSPSQPGDATPSSRQGTGDTGTPTGAARAMPGPGAPEQSQVLPAAPAALRDSSVPPGSPGRGWAAPPVTPQGGTAEPPRGSAVPGSSSQPHPHPAAFLEPMAAGKRGRQARGGHREPGRQETPSPHAGHGREGSPGASGDSPDIN